MPLEYLTRIAQMPAPTFAEGKRAELILRLWRDLGYDPRQDSAGNVIARIAPPKPTAKKALVLASHLDTVFSAATDVSVRKKGHKWYGPGLGDNSSSLAVLTAFLRDLNPRTLQVPLWVVANTAEEGLGDLRGAKTLLAEHHTDIAAFVAVDGYLGVTVTKAVGVRRYRATFSGKGGHSWGPSVPSTNLAAGRAIAALYELRLPQFPRTTLNVGCVEGGVSVNSIAAETTLLLDLRSIGEAELRQLDRAALEILYKAAHETGVTLQTERVGDRPGGDLNAGPLLTAVQEASRRMGLRLHMASSSTDANAAVPYQMPALSLGVYTGGNAHRLDEWVDPSSHAQGLELLKSVVQLYQQRPL